MLAILFNPIWAEDLTRNLDYAVGAARAQSYGIEYRFGDEAKSNGGAAGESSARTISEGLQMLGSGGSQGMVGGAIGASLPSPAQSARAREAQVQRRVELRDQALTAPPPLPVANPAAYLQAYNERRFAETGDPIYLRDWATQDPQIRSQLGELYLDLRAAPAATPERAAVRDFGLAAVEHADVAFADGQTEEGVFLYSLGQAAADILIGIDPITGTLRGVYEATTGENLVTGAKLNDFERGLAVVNVVSLGFGGKIEKGVSIFCKAGRGAFGLVYGSRAMAHVRRIVSALESRVFRGPSLVVLTASDRRALEILVHASAGPRLRVERILHVDGVGGPLSRNIELRSPELFDLKNGKVYNGHAGTLTRAQADEIGMTFVGDDFIPFNGETIGFRSADGLRQYRPPAVKTGYGLQANFETFAPFGAGRKKELSDVHVNIVE